MNPILQRIAQDHRAAVDGLFASETETLETLAKHCANALKNGKKLLFCGNGGSACDAMHIAGEFVGRFVHDRPALAALALTPDSGILTAIANDYSYAEVFSRQVEALGQAGDVLVGMSTSGTSPNVLKAIEAANNKGIFTALLTGEKGRNAASGAALALVVPSRITAHVQEVHMLALHAVASLVEAELYPHV